MNILFKFFPINKISLIWKTLIAVVLSILLIAPSPALALVDYNSTLQSYVSDIKVQLDTVVTSIKKMPTLSYENGQKTLTEIDGKLQEIQNGASKNAKDFKDLSNKAQKEYENYLTLVKSGFNKQYLINSSNSIDRQYLYCLDLRDAYNYFLREQERNWISDSPLYLSEFAYIEQCFDTINSFPSNKKKDADKLTSILSLNNKISKLCDDLEKRVDLAKQKAKNIKDYAEALRSFSDPDVMREISDLDVFIANLTKNLPNAS